jgi:hypothetical protein
MPTTEHVLDAAVITDPARVYPTTTPAADGKIHYKIVYLPTPLAAVFDSTGVTLDVLLGALATQLQDNWSNLGTATVATAAATAAKTATISNASMLPGLTFSIKFTAGNTANVPTLNINQGGAYPLRTIYNDALGNIPANTTLLCYFAGDAWITTLIPDATVARSGTMSAADKQSISDMLAQLITLAQTVQANSAAIANLEDMVLANLTSNAFSITFSDLSGGTLVSGIWNETLQRIEC